MSKALMCDRCKTCFRPDDFGSASKEDERMYFKNPTFQTAEDYRARTYSHRLITEDPDATVDFCPDCTKKFLKWMGWGVDDE